MICTTSLYCALYKLGKSSSFVIAHHAHVRSPEKSINSHTTLFGKDGPALSPTCGATFSIRRGMTHSH